MSFKIDNSFSNLKIHNCLKEEVVQEFKECLNCIKNVKVTRGVWFRIKRLVTLIAALGKSLNAFKMKL